MLWDAIATNADQPSKLNRRCQVLWNHSSLKVARRCQLSLSVTRKDCETGFDETQFWQQRYQCKDCQVRFDDLSRFLSSSTFASLDVVPVSDGIEPVKPTNCSGTRPQQGWCAADDGPTAGGLSKISPKWRLLVRWNVMKPTSLHR